MALEQLSNLLPASSQLILLVEALAADCISFEFSLLHVQLHLVPVLPT